MLVNRIKHLFYSWGIQKEWASIPILSLFPYISYLILVLLKHPTWYLLYIKTSELNIIVWLWQRPCVRYHGVTTSVRAPWRFLYHINRINSDVRRHFLIDGYGKFPSLRRTISYPQTMSAYDVFLSLSYPSISTMYLIPSFFDPIITIFSTVVLSLTLLVS